MNKKVPPRIFIDNLEALSSEQIMASKHFRDALKFYTPIRIELALEQKTAAAILFQIGTSNSYIEIPKRHFTSALQKCLNWYIEEENYIECGNIKKLIARCNKIKVDGSNEQQ